MGPAYGGFVLPFDKDYVLASEIGLTERPIPAKLSGMSQFVLNIFVIS